MWMEIDGEALEDLRQFLRHHAKDPTDAALLLCATLITLQEDYSIYNRDTFAEDVAEIIRSAHHKSGKPS